MKEMFVIDAGSNIANASNVSQTSKIDARSDHSELATKNKIQRSALKGLKGMAKCLHYNLFSLVLLWLW